AVARPGADRLRVIRGVHRRGRAGAEVAHGVVAPAPDAAADDRAGVVERAGEGGGAGQRRARAAGAARAHGHRRGVRVVVAAGVAEAELATVIGAPALDCAAGAERARVQGR